MKKHTIFYKFILSLASEILLICPSAILSCPPKYSSINAIIQDLDLYTKEIKNSSEDSKQHDNDNLELYIKQITDYSEHLSNDLMLSENALGIIYGVVQNTNNLLCNNQLIINNLLEANISLNYIYIDLFKIFKAHGINLQMPEFVLDNTDNNNQFSDDYNTYKLNHYITKVNISLDHLIKNFTHAKNDLNIIDHYSQGLNLSKQCKGLIEKLEAVNEMINNVYKKMYYIFDVCRITFQVPEIPFGDANNEIINSSIFLHYCY